MEILHIKAKTISFGLFLLCPYIRFLLYAIPKDTGFLLDSSVFLKQWLLTFA